MRSVYEERVEDAREITRQICASPTNLSGRKFGSIAKILWPVKTAAVLADLSGRDQRTAERWLSGEYEPPVCIILAMLDEIFKKQ